MKIAIIGHVGHGSSVAARHIKDSGHDVICIDDLSSEEGKAMISARGFGKSYPFVIKPAPELEEYHAFAKPDSYQKKYNKTRYKHKLCKR